MRNVIQEGRDAMTVLKEMFPQLVELYGQYGPGMAQAEEKTARARAAAQIAGVKELGPDMLAALESAVPELGQARGAIGRQLGELGPSAIESELSRQARADLALGGRLSAEQERASQQASRAAMSARGLSRGVPAAVLEVLNREQASQARLEQRRGFAGAMDAYTQNRRSGDRAFSQSALNTLNAVYDPMQRLYGQGGSQVSGMTGGQQIFGPYMNASQDVGRTNQQAATQWAISQAQLAEQARQFDASQAWEQQAFGMNQDYATWATNKQSRAATTNGIISGVGSIAGAAILAMFL